ncbi:hypothetical protein Y032_0051g2126 [Ancylostoma ceylanicum]|uniref:Uncharacterized protein n=1 Tax=Ancylostoma ceylanicum TaxID=53326 RepID=A0A016U9K2_9BILA|nr:hypothetical protein Y032_0051g2126 [Ancylostoma ceylanicum]
MKRNLASARATCKKLGILHTVLPNVSMRFYVSDKNITRTALKIPQYLIVSEEDDMAVFKSIFRQNIKVNEKVQKH